MFGIMMNSTLSLLQKQLRELAITSELIQTLKVHAGDDKEHIDTDA